MLIAGVDPGKTGGLIILNEAGKIIYDDIFDKIENRTELFDKIGMLKKKFKELHVFKEEFASYGVDGRTSFVVGKEHGIIDSALRHFDLPSTFIKPSIWGAHFNLLFPGNEDLKPKVRNQKLAIKLFPEFSFIPKGRRVPHFGLIDAALIAHYGLSVLK